MLGPSQEITKMLAIIKKYHSHQTRSPSNIPYWHHLVSVTEILQRALLDSQEVGPRQSLYPQLLLAALGHDLYEDTTVSPDLIKKKFGEPVHRLIQLMTNRNGDHDRAAYVKQIQAAPETVKLIKLADLVENTLSASQRLHELGSEWGTKFLLPIIDEMSPQVSPEYFSTYPKTAALLWQQYRFAHNRFTDNIAKFLE